MAIDTEAQDAVPVTTCRFARYRAKNRVKRNAENAKWWRENGAAYREKNREKLRAISAKWRANNLEVSRARCKAHQQAYPEKQRESERKYRAVHADRRKASCAKYRSDPSNLEKERIAQAAWAKANSDKLAASAAIRRALKLQATPSWADMDAIKAIYAKAKQITADTGIMHHVDHIYPLKSKMMCGLHVETNLQILTGPENLRKGNRHWPGNKV